MPKMHRFFWLVHKKMSSTTLQPLAKIDGLDVQVILTGTERLGKSGPQKCRRTSSNLKKKTHISFLKYVLLSGKPVLFPSWRRNHSAACNLEKVWIPLSFASFQHDRQIWPMGCAIIMLLLLTRGAKEQTFLPHLPNQCKTSLREH